MKQILSLCLMILEIMSKSGRYGNEPIPCWKLGLFSPDILWEWDLFLHATEQNIVLRLCGLNSTPHDPHNMLLNLFILRQAVAFVEQAGEQ